MKSQGPHVPPYYSNRGGHGPRFTIETFLNLSSAQPYAGDPSSAVGFYRQMEVRK